MPCLFMRHSLILFLTRMFRLNMWLIFVGLLLHWGLRRLVVHNGSVYFMQGWFWDRLNENGLLIGVGTLQHNYLFFRLKLRGCSRFGERERRIEMRLGGFIMIPGLGSRNPG